MMPDMTSGKPSERGAALLSVLILVGILGALAVAVFDRLRLATTLASNSAGITEARAYAGIAETLVAMRIGDLAAASATRTTLAGGWQDRPTTLPLPNGTAEVRVRDGGNCFNLNSLVAGSAQALVARPIAVDQFARLMTLLTIPEAQARRIAAASADWIDSNGDAYPDGAEDSVYARAAAPYRTANTLMVEASEWRAVSGVTPEVYARIRPWLCALPIADLSPLNVNTLLPDQAPLLAMLFPGTLGVAAARRIIAERPDPGWSDIGAFWNTDALRGIDPPADAFRQPQARTTWFAVDMRVRAGESELRETALFDARQQSVRIATRRWTRDE